MWLEFWLICSIYSMTLSGDMIIRVTCMDRHTVATLTMQSNHRCLALKNRISQVLSICTCKIKLCAGSEIMRNGLEVKRYSGRIAPDNVVNLTLQTTDVSATTIAQLFQDQVCFKCMKDAGASAEDIFQHVVRNALDIDAVELRRPGFTLSQLVQARNEFSILTARPTVSQKTLLDSPLKQAGYIFGQGLSKCWLSCL